MDIQKQLFDSFEIDAQPWSENNNQEEQLRAIRQLLIQRIDELIRTDFDKLKWILYRIDINEKKLTEALKGDSGADAASIMADMIIARQIEKAESRKKFGQGNTDNWSFDM